MSIVVWLLSLLQCVYKCARANIGRQEGPRMQVRCHRVIVQPDHSRLVAAEEEAGD